MGVRPVAVAAGQVLLGVRSSLASWGPLTVTRPCENRRQAGARATARTAASAFAACTDGLISDHAEILVTLECPLRRVACVRSPDPAFADPHLAALYDGLDDDRSDLDAYVAIADELNASRIIDIGCGTGSLATRLAALGKDVVGVDPAGASLEVARGKPHADRVSWVHGDATALPVRHLAADLAVMTGNVAQVFVADADWASTLDAIRACLRPDGWLVFETRLPQARDWEGWDVRPTVVTTVPGGLEVVISRTVTEVEPPLVTFVSSTEVNGDTIHSTSTLRFRERHEVEQDLQDHGFEVVDVRDAPDRPGKEMVFLARLAGTGSARNRPEALH